MDRITTTMGRGPRRAEGTTKVLAGALLVALMAITTGCNAFGDPDEQESTVDVERESREEGDVEGAVGDELEVYGVMATVTSIERVESFSEIDNRGYIVATVEMTNPTNSSVDYNRTDWQLEKPDGTTSNTTNVSGEAQLQDDTLPAGASVEGTVIFTAGDLDGQFAILFEPATLRPEDELETERAVWVFESAPGDAS